MGGMDDYKEFIHFGLTSQDINNTSVPLSIKEALDQVYYPLIEELIAQLKTYATEWANIPMFAKTHGQPASPTRLGKEVMVFVYRLERQLAMLKACPLTAKFGGATGNYNAHHVAFLNMTGNNSAIGLLQKNWDWNAKNIQRRFRTMITSLLFLML